MIGVIAVMACQAAMPKVSKAERISALWTQLPHYPDENGVAGAIAGVSHGALLVGGGANFPVSPPWDKGPKVWYEDVYALSSPKGTWKLVGKMPRKMGYGVSVSYENKVICVGGGDAKKNYSSVFSMELIHGKLKIEKLPTLPISTANECGALVGSYLYAACGQQTPQSDTALNRVFRLNLKDTSAGWKEIAHLPGAGRILPVAASYGGDFWVFGGASLHPDGKGGAARTYLKDAYRYSPKSGWKRIANVPHALVAAPTPAPTFGNGIYLLGGDDGSTVGMEQSKRPEFPKTVLRYDLSSGKWIKAGLMPAGRVTVPTALWRGAWIIPNGEMRPGVRSPEVWSVKFSHPVVKIVKKQKAK